MSEGKCWKIFHYLLDFSLCIICGKFGWKLTLGCFLFQKGKKVPFPSAQGQPLQEIEFIIQSLKYKAQISGKIPKVQTN
jgi:hypothetical protein